MDHALPQGRPHTSRAAPPSTVPWHQLDAREALRRLGTDPARGLSEAEAKRRLEEHGPNELVDRGVKSPWRIGWEQLTSVMVVMLARQIVWVGLLMGIVALAVGYLAGHGGDWPTGGVWQTMVFTTLTLSQMGNAMAMRSERDSLFGIGISSSPMMIGAVALTFALQLAIVYVPFLQQVFQTRGLSLRQLAVCVLLSTPVFWAFELEKWLARRRESPNAARPESGR